MLRDERGKFVSPKALVISPEGGRLRDRVGRFVPKPPRGDLVHPLEAAEVVAASLVGKVRREAESTLSAARLAVTRAEVQLERNRGTAARLGRAVEALREMAEEPSADQRYSLRYARQQVGIWEPKLVVAQEKLVGAERRHREVTRRGGMQTVLAAEEGMRYFLRVIKETWWERSGSALTYVGYAPKFMFGIKRGTQRYWADVGPFLVKVTVNGGISVAIPPLEDQAHCSGRRDYGVRNYHPHVRTCDNYAICWGDFDRLVKEAKEEGSPFGVMELADRLLRLCKRGHLYDPMFRYWNHRPRRTSCDCPGCKSGHLSESNGDPCPCFACREDRGETWTVPKGVLWADQRLEG